MLQKFNITTYAVVLCLFGFMLFTAAPVFADPQGEFDDCKEMEKGKGKNRLSKLRCFKDLAEELLEINENLRTGDNEDASRSGRGRAHMCDMLEAVRTRNTPTDDPQIDWILTTGLNDIRHELGCM